MKRAAATVAAMPVRVVTLVDRIGAAGGGERFALDVATGLDPARFESILCVSRPSPAAAVAAVRASGTRVVELERRSRWSVLPWLRLAELLRRERVDVLHSHKFGSNVWGSLVARRSGVPVFVAHEHSWSFSGDALRRLLDRHLVAPRASAILAVSDLDRRRIVQHTRVEPGRVIVQPNGVALPERPRPGRLREELGCSPSTTIVGIVARLAPVKRIDLFVDAIARLRSGGADVHGVVVGGGEEEERLRAQARSLALDGGLTFLGSRENAAQLAADFDVAVLCSDREGCPLTLLEYMALGRPIVATRVGGIPDAVRHRKEALLVEPGDDRALAAAIRQLLASPAHAAALGEAAAERQAGEYDLEAVVRRLEGLYESLLGITRSRPACVTVQAALQPNTVHGDG